MHPQKQPEHIQKKRTSVSSNRPHINIYWTTQYKTLFHKYERVIKFWSICSVHIYVTKGDIFQHIFEMRLRNGVRLYGGSILLMDRHRKKHYLAIRGTRLKNLLEKYLLFAKVKTKRVFFRSNTKSISFQNNMLLWKILIFKLYT